MSLTSHLDDPGSPVRRYLETHFADLRAIRHQDPTTGTVPVPFPRTDPLVLTADPDGYPWSVAGTAFDYRLRLTYADPARPPGFDAAAAGARLLPEPTTWIQTSAALATLAARPALRDPDSGRTVRLCGLLALFDQLHRMPATGPAHDRHPLVVGRGALPLDDALTQVDDRVPGDVTAMTDLYARTQPQLLPRAGRAVVTGPLFARSGDLGGADADLLIYQTLLELKATRGQPLDKRTVWQLLGYLLADTDDRWGITTFAVYFARHGLVWTFDVPQFLRRLAGHDVDLATARAECATARQPQSPRPRVPTARLILPTDRHRVPGPAVPGRGRPPRRGVLPVRDRPRRLAPGRPGPRPGHVLEGARRTGRSGCAGPVRRPGAAGHRRHPDRGGGRHPAGDIADHLCRLCRVYVHASWVPAGARPADPTAGSTRRYYPPLTGPGRWHTTAPATGHPYFGPGDAPACGTATILDLDRDPLPGPDGGDPDGVDGRLCRRCLAIPAPGAATNEKADTPQ